MSRVARLIFASVVALTLVGSVRPAGAAVPVVVTAQAVAEQIETQLRGCMQFESLKVEVVPFPDKVCAQQGHFQSVGVSCDRAQSGQFVFRDFQVKACDVTLNLEKLFAAKPTVEKTAGGKTEITGRVLAADLNAVLQKNGSWVQHSGLTNMAVHFSDGAIQFTGEAKDLCGAEVEVTGGLKIREATRLDFAPTGAKVNGFPVPVVLVKGLLKKLNPLYNFGELPLQPTINQVTITTEYILVQG
jgi:hypothetical protein